MDRSSQILNSRASDASCECSSVGEITAQYDLDALGEAGIYPNMGMKTVRQG